MVFSGEISPLNLDWPKIQTLDSVSWFSWMGSRLKYWIFFYLSFPKESFLLKYWLQYRDSLIVIKRISSDEN